MKLLIEEFSENTLEAMLPETAAFISESFEKFYSSLIDSDDSEGLLCSTEHTHKQQRLYEIYCHTQELFEAFIEMSHYEGQNILRPGESRFIDVEATKEYKEQHMGSIPSMIAFMMAEMPKNLGAEKKQEYIHHMVYDILHLVSQQAYYSGSRLTWDLISA